MQMYLGARREDGLEGVEAVVELLPTLALGDHVLQLVPGRLGRRRRLLLVVILLLLLLVAVPHRLVHPVKDRHGRLEHPLPTCRLRQTAPGAEVSLVAPERGRARGRRHSTRRRRHGCVVEVGDVLIVVGEHHHSGHR